MKRISLSEVQSLPNGTRVLVCNEGTKSWHTKQKNGLHCNGEKIKYFVDIPHDMEVDFYIIGCDCCLSNKPIDWIDNENNTFVTKSGEMVVKIKGESMEFPVTYCPNCGKKFVKNICKHVNEDGICTKGASSSGKCIRPCSYFESFNKC